MTFFRNLFTLLLAAALAAPAWGATIVVQSVADSGDTPTPTDNDFTRINDALQGANDGDTFELQGTFDWSETNAAASWAAGSNGTPEGGGGDDYYLDVPATNDLTITAASLGSATIQGPGDLPGVYLESFLVFDSGHGNFHNLTISNLRILDFDLSLGMFYGGGDVHVFDGTTVTQNFIHIPADLAGRFENAGLGISATGELYQNIGIHFSFGDNQTISDNVIEMPGDGLSDRSNPDSNYHVLASSVAMQSNTSGGAYEGLLIDNNEIRILDAQSADPEVLYGIWENGHAHTKNITVSNNRFSNLAAGNDPAANIQNAFRVTSHSSLSSTVTYSGNEVQGAHLGLAQLTGFGGQDFSAHEPIQVLANTFLDNDTAVLVRSLGKDVLRCNRFFGNNLAIGNEGVIADADAAENWFGCNSGPGFGACDSTDANVAVAPWLALGISVDDPTLKAGETSAVTVDLLHTSAGGFASCDPPASVPAELDAFGGSIVPGMDELASGLLETTFTAGGNTGLATLSALVDGQLVATFVSVTATETDLSISKNDGFYIAPSGTTLTYAIDVVNNGPSSVNDAKVQDSPPAFLSGCTWTCAAAGGASCTSIGAVAIDDTVDIPAGASLHYELTCLYTAPNNEPVFNTGVVSVPAGMVELDASDNTDLDRTYPTEHIFSDGFESGNTSAWSAAVGGG